jgi:hypothetical protein
MTHARRALLCSAAAVPLCFGSAAFADPPPPSPQLAFPTAEGFGKYAKGGRGGDVYIVNTLNDAGAGSLRECAEASGPRTCVFSISGEIQLSDQIHVTSPYPMTSLSGSSAVAPDRRRRNPRKSTRSW